MGCKRICSVDPGIHKCCLECEKYEECTILCDDLDLYEYMEGCPDYVKEKKKMKNKEKFEKKIIEIVCEKGAVNKQTGELKRCGEVQCKYCLFSAGSCEEEMREWLESEYIEKPVISKKDRAFLEYLGKDLKYISRDKSEALFAYERAIEKGKHGWVYDSGVLKNLRGFSVDLPMVKWSDDKPWLIENLKKLEVVEDYE